ncbi:MAG: glycosyltransferase [Anaerolineales bacterium]|nr:glycosyltransferase [Anaerolineales bacterium]
MRIAYLSSADVPSPSANSLQVMKMCQAFVREGHEVHLILPPAERGSAESGGGPLSDREAAQYGLTVRFPVRRVRLLPLLGRRGLAWAEADEAARIVPNLVYTRGIDIAWAVAQHGFPVMLEVHHEPTGRLGPLYFRQILGRRNLRLAVISRALEENLRRAYPALCSREMLVAPDAVDGEQYRNPPAPARARARLKLPAARFTAGYFGSLVAGRGVELICEMARRSPTAQFLILGGHPQEVADWKVRAAGVNNVRWLGHVPNAEIPLYQAACDVLLMPYQREVTVRGRGDTAAIMSPMKLYEYMAAGRAILSSDLPALRVMLNENNSLLLPPEDPAAWAEALAKIRQNPNRRKRIAARARADVRECTWRNRVKRILEFIAANHG